MYVHNFLLVHHQISVYIICLFSDCREVYCISITQVPSTKSTLTKHLVSMWLTLLKQRRKPPTPCINWYKTVNVRWLRDFAKMQAFKDPRNVWKYHWSLAKASRKPEEYIRTYGFSKKKCTTNIKHLYTWFNILYRTIYGINSWVPNGTCGLSTRLEYYYRLMLMLWRNQGP